jgi:hypothetical protein
MPGGSVITTSPSRRRLPALVAGLLTGLIGAGSLAPFVAPVQAATTVTPATGGGAISADTAANAPAPAWTSLTGPSIAVTQAGDIPTGSITLTAPSGFTFNSSSTPTIDAGTSGLAGTCAAPASMTVTCTVTTQTTAAGTVAFSGIAVQPTARTPLASGVVTFGGTSGLTGTAASLAEVPGTAAKLGFSIPPGGGTAWTAWATQPVVVVQDAAGNTIAGSGTAITLAIGTNPPGSGALTCAANPLSTTAGTAAFSGCSIDKVGTGYTLVATSGALTAATSQAFTITAGQNLLAFTTQPGGGAAGTAFATQPVVTVKDPGGTTDATSTAAITLQIGTNPGGGSLTCTGGLTKAAVAGVATFAGCMIDRPGTGYTLTAIATNLTGVTSVPFNVVAGAPASLVFSVQPGAAAAGYPLSPQPEITLRDSAGNTATGSSAPITLAITAGTGTSGAALTCSGGTTLAATNGVATFSGCAISKAGAGYKLTATASGLAAAISTAFTVSAAPATQLAVTTQPSTTAGAATAFAVQPVVTIRDATGATVTTSTAAVTLSVTPGTGTPSATLACTGGLAKSAASGVATFAGCNIDLLGAGYTLTATASGLTSATTAATTIVPGAATKVAVTTQPVGAAYGTSFATQPVVTIQDKMGNTVTSSSASVTLAITAGTGTAGAVLTCSGGNSKVAASGVATFSGCSISKAGTGYKVTATATSLTAATSTAFDIAVGAPAKLAFITQPGGSAVGTALNPQPGVAIQDAAGNLVTSSTLGVALAITGGTGAAGAAITCTGGNTSSAVGGVAAFSGCAIDKVGSGYTLTASSGALTTGLSTAFTIAAGTASKLALSVQPIGGTVGSLLSQQPVVLIQDAAGNTVTSSNASVTLSIGTNPSGGVLTCGSGLSKAATSGVATFAGCKIDKVGSGYTITAVASGLMGTTSAPLDITPGVAAKLVIVVQPTGGAYATAFPTQPSIAVQDSLGNTVTTFNGTVVLAPTPGTGTAGAILTCTGGLSKATTSGVATFAGCAIDKPGTSYTLTATLTGVTNAVSTAFTITPGAATQLAFSVQPAGAVAGTAFTTQPKVKVLDAGGNLVTGSSAGIALSITGGTGTGGATLSCTGGTTVFAVNGVATFSGCKIDLVGANYTLTAASTGLSSGVSAAISVSAGPPVKLGFSVPPAGAAAGTAFTTQPVVTIQDAGGNTVTASAASVTLAITAGTGTSGAALSCTSGTAVTAVNGFATFAGCQITKVGANYTLKATSGTLTLATSGALTVTPGAPAKLVFTTQPVGAAYSLPFATQPVVTIQDASGNTATQSVLNVTLAISPGTGAAGAARSCTGGTTIAAVAGIAAFTGCTIDMASTTYALVATAAGVTSAGSGTFTVLPGAPDKLAISIQPAGASASVAFATQPVVIIQDAAGNTITTSTLTVTLSITPGTGTSGAILSCGTSPSKAAVAGVATFAACKIDRPGTGYTLTATSGALTPAVSALFDIASGPPAKLAITTQPVGAAISTAFATQPVVTIQDSTGASATSSSAVVTLSITAGTGSTGAILSCGGGLSIAAVSGVATFAGCQIDRAAGGYTLKATSGTLTAATSSALTITPGPASKLAVTTPPAGAGAGAAFTTQPTITVQDASSGTASASVASITLALGNNPTGATLTCTGGLSQAAAAGVAAFSGCAIDKIGIGYTLVATSGALTSATSVAFNVTAGAAAKLILTTQPSAGAAFSTALAQQPVVTIQDAAGNTATTSTQSVTIAITPGTGVAGAKLTCTGGLSKAPVAGVATFSGCAIDKAGTGYTLTVTAGSLTAAVSSAITITAGAATKTVFTTSPPATAAAGTAFTAQPVVTIQDTAGNTVSSAVLTVTLSIVAPASTTAVLTCTGGLSKAAVAGVATFAGCAIDKTGTGYAIGATVSGLTSAKSGTIAVTAGAAAKVAFTTDPTGAAGGVAFAKQPTVAVQDTYGNTATTNTGTVTLALSAGTGTAGAILTCTGGLSKATVAGVAAFAGCAIDKAGTGYKLTATVTGLTDATSAALDISQGPAKQLGFETQPVGGPGGLEFPSQPVVAVQDAGGATVAAGTATVTLAITAGTGTAGAVLSCTGGLVQTAVSGLATFSGCTIDRAGTGYTLSATSGSLTLDVSDPLDVSAPVAVMTVTPATTAIRYGAATTLGVAFSFAGANATVNLEESLDGTTWTLVSPVTTDANGSATFTYLVATSRWFRATYPGDRELLPGTSKPVKVAVQYSTILRPTNKGATKTIRHGKAITFTTTVRPTVASTPRTSVTFEIYKLVGGKWAFVTRRVVATNALGTASLKWTFAKTGTWSVRARAAGTTQNSTSPWTARETYRVT